MNGLILIVEDDKTLAGLFAQSLRAASFDVEIVHTMAEADARVDREPKLACIVLDQYLPNGLGVEMLDGFENRHPSTHIPIIALTGADVSPAAVYKAGMQALLIKPVSVKNLVDTVSDVVSNFVSNKMHEPMIRSVKELRAELARALASA